VRRWREVWYDPWQLQSLGTRPLAHFLAEAGADPERVEELAVGLQTVARRAVALFGTLQGAPAPYVDYATLQEQVLLELRLLAVYETEHQAVRQWVQRLYRSRNTLSSAVVQRTVWAVSNA
jgi:hypothetical protein